MVSSLIIIVVAALWGALHSLLAAHSVRARLERYLGRAYRLVYNLVAALTLLPLLGLVPLLPDRLLYQISPPWAWGMVGVQLTAVVAAGVTLLQTDAWRFFGLRQLLEAEPLGPNRLVLRGAYRWVRHPLYTFSLIFLWFSPLMTRNQLVLYLIFSLYLYLGAIFEERKLRRQFGERYRNYQQQVPMLIPWRLPGRF